MTRILSYLEALSEGLRQELEADPSVVVFGEDNIGGTGCDGTLGNAWGPTKGLHEKYPAQVFDAPITEAAFVGAAVGAAATGLRPVTDLLFIDFAGVCFDQILNQADIASLVAANAYGALRGPVRMVTSPHAPTPFSPVLEDAYAPSAAQIASAVLATRGSAREQGTAKETEHAS
jgi:pyruvate/2-oxoglutarate/acetoin dehydrogenase E1 component